MRLVADAADDRGARLERAGAGTEEDVERGVAVAHRRGLHVGGRDVVRALDVFAPGRDVGAAGDVVHDVADGRLDARSGQQLLRVGAQRVTREVVRERGEL